MFVCLMVFNATFNNISVISWQSVLLVEKTVENHLSPIGISCTDLMNKVLNIMS